jgi:hypothetical protein
MDRYPVTQAALWFQFAEDGKARIAWDTLRELGYEPQLHEGGQLHIHVRGEDLTSALEIVQICGGDMVRREPADTVLVDADGCGAAAIPIPAHTVNEDWPEPYADRPEPEPPRESRFDPDTGEYDHFEAR